MSPAQQVPAMPAHASIQPSEFSRVRWPRTRMPMPLRHARALRRAPSSGNRLLYDFFPGTPERGYVSAEDLAPPAAEQSVSRGGAGLTQYGEPAGAPGAAHGRLPIIWPRRAASSPIQAASSSCPESRRALR